MKLTKKLKAALDAAQMEAGVTEMQSLITSGDVWKFEGFMGREAMSLLESGACYLPEKETFDYWGNRIPSRDDLQPGTKGTLENSLRFYNLQTN